MDLAEQAVSVGRTRRQATLVIAERTWLALVDQAEQVAQADQADQVDQALVPTGGLVLTDAEGDPASQLVCAVEGMPPISGGGYRPQARAVSGVFALAAALDLVPAFCWESRVGDAGRPPSGVPRPAVLLITFSLDDPRDRTRWRAWDERGREVAYEIA